nr:MAG TPA: hypothetical protein [Caudoviricetes sp.]
MIAKITPKILPYKNINQNNCANIFIFSSFLSFISSFQKSPCSC